VSIGAVVQAASVADPSGTVARWVVLLVGILVLAGALGRALRKLAEIVVLLRDMETAVSGQTELRKATEANTSAVMALTRRLDQAGL